MNKKIFFLILVFLTISCGTQKIITKKDLLYNSTSENLDKFGSFLWSKNKNNSIIINKQNVDIIKSKKGMYSKSILKYITYLTRPTYRIKNIEFSERSKILAFLIFYGKEIQLKDEKYSLIENVIFDDENLFYYNEFEKNNYYNLPNLKKEYKEKFEELKPPKKLDLKPVIDIIDKSD